MGFRALYLRFGAPSVAIDSTKTSSTSNNCATMHTDAKVDSSMDPSGPSTTRITCQISVANSKKGLKMQNLVSNVGRQLDSELPVLSSFKALAKSIQPTVPATG